MTGPPHDVSRVSCRSRLGTTVKTATGHGNPLAAATVDEIVGQIAGRTVRRAAVLVAELVDLAGLAANDHSPTCNSPAP